MGKKSKACFLIILLQILNSVRAQDMFKRAPQGFLGMRGKKPYNSEEIDNFYKRKPHFFVGVKGKKNLLDIQDDAEVYYKRAPMGFVGMRGKKDDDLPEFFSPEIYEPKRDGSLIGQIDYSAKNSVDLENLEYPLLKGLLTKFIQSSAANEAMDQEPSQDEVESNQIDQNSTELPEGHITNEINKRAANVHQFFGMRGKKMQNKRPFDVTFRGKFIGVRGKKDLKNSEGLQEIKFLLDNSAPWPKRKVQNGFFGMRGKKWTDGSSQEMDYTN